MLLRVRLSTGTCSQIKNQLSFLFKEGTDEFQDCADALEGYMKRYPQFFSAKLVCFWHRFFSVYFQLYVCLSVNNGCVLVFVHWKSVHVLLICFIVPVKLEKYLGKFISENVMMSFIIWIKCSPDDQSIMN